VYVQKRITARKYPEDPYKLTQIKITCPPDYGIAKVMAKHIISQILKDNDEVSIDETKETAEIYVKLGSFAYEDVNTFEQNPIRVDNK
jgi:disulfide oxidoreductase YuzD